MFRLFEGQVNDESISSYQWTRFTPEENDVSRQSLNRISIKTKDLDSYLDICKAYLSVEFHLGSIAAPNTLGADDRHTMGSILAGIFRKYSLSLNGVVLNENDNAQFNMQIQQLLTFSQDYQDKHGRALGMFYNTAANNTPATLLANTFATQGAAFLKTGADPNRIQFKIPLAQLFGFVRSFTGMLRGCELRIDLEKEENPYRYHFGSAAGPATALPAVAIIDSLELWVPKVTPSLSAENFYLSNLSSGKSQRIVYEDAVTYINNVTVANNYLSLQVQSNSKKPRYVFVGFKVETRWQGLQGNVAGIVNHTSLYDPRDLENIQLRINSENLPREPYALNFAASTLARAQNASRAYRDFVELLQGGEEDHGSLVGYGDYLNYYPIVCFDLSREKPSLFQNVNNNYIEIVAPRMADGAVIVLTTIVWEREIEIRGTNKSIEIKRM
jgi:hypothetical protein